MALGVSEHCLQPPCKVRTAYPATAKSKRTKSIEKKKSAQQHRTTYERTKETEFSLSEMNCMEANAVSTLDSNCCKAAALASGRNEAGKKERKKIFGKKKNRQ